MDGDKQSDSSSESGSESGSSGQGTSAEVLQALKSLTQKVDKLNEKVGNTESSLKNTDISLKQLESKIDGIVGNGGNIEISELCYMDSTSSAMVEVPEGARIFLGNSYRK